MNTAPTVISTLAPHHTSELSSRRQHVHARSRLINVITSDINHGLYLTLSRKDSYVYGGVLKNTRMNPFRHYHFRLLLLHHHHSRYPLWVLIYHSVIAHDIAPTFYYIYNSTLPDHPQWLLLPTETYTYNTMPVTTFFHI